MTDRTTRQLTAIAGVASFVFIVASLIVLGNYPGDNAPAQDVAKFTNDHRDRILTSMYLLGIGLALILCFLTGLWAVIRPTERGSGAWSTLGLIGGLGWVAVEFAGVVFAYNLGYRKNPDPGVARMLLDGVLLAGNLNGFPTAVSLLGFSGAVLLSKSFPNWLGWAGLVIAAVHLVFAASFAGSGLFAPSIGSGTIAPVLYYLWVLAFCVLLWLSVSGTARATTRAAGAA